MKPQKLTPAKLKKMREELGYTQDELAKELEVAPRTITNRETEHKRNMVYAYAIVALTLLNKKS